MAKKKKAKTKVKNVGDLATLAKPDHSSIGRRSKRKGSRFENAVAHTLDDWYYPEYREKLGADRILRRTPLSGGWCKTGDIQVNPKFGKDVPPFPFHVETKKREGWCLENLLLNEKCPILLEWWVQCSGEASDDVSPLLIFAKNLIQPLCILRISDCPPVSFDRFLLTEDELVIVPLTVFCSVDPKCWDTDDA